jgi:hypothetical protein
VGRISAIGLVAVTSALVLLAGAAPTSGRTVLKTKVGTSDAVKRNCFARPSAGPGVVARTVRTRSAGLLKVRLRAARGDWDVGVFDTRTGRTVAGSAHFRSRELAESYVGKGTSLRIQACRRSGRSRRASLVVAFQAIKAPKKPARAQLVDVSAPNRRAAG